MPTTELILPPGDLFALRKRVEAHFQVKMQGCHGEARGGSYFRWPYIRSPLLRRINPFRRKENPPFDNLLIYWNGEEAWDAEPFIDGYPMESFICEVDGDRGGTTQTWLQRNEGAILVSGT